MTTKYIKQGDTSPYVRAVIQSISGDPPVAAAVNLTGATIKFIMRAHGSSAPKVNATLEGTELVDLPNGEVQYEWDGAEGDTDTPGSYLAEFEVTDANGKVTTYWDMRTAKEIEDDQPPEPLVIVIVGDLA